MRRSIPPLYQQVKLRGHIVNFEIDSGANDTICSKDTWIKVGKPKLQPVEAEYKVADGNPLQVLGQFEVTAELDGKAGGIDLKVVVTNVPQLNLLGRQAMVELGLTDLTGHFMRNMEGPKKLSVGQLTTESTVGSLQKACKQCCQEFPDLFKPELGCLKNFELEVKFKPEAKPIFCRPRPVPLAILEDLNDAYEDGIRKGVWKPTDFNAYGTPVVPVRKASRPGQSKARIRVCGDYSVTVNSQLETHRQPIPLPEDLMRNL